MTQMWMTVPIKRHKSRREAPIIWRSAWSNCPMRTQMGAKRMIRPSKRSKRVVRDTTRRWTCRGPPLMGFCQRSGLRMSRLGLLLSPMMVVGLANNSIVPSVPNMSHSTTHKATTNANPPSLTHKANQVLICHFPSDKKPFWRTTWCSSKDCHPWYGTIWWSIHRGLWKGMVWMKRSRWETMSRRWICSLLSKALLRYRWGISLPTWNSH